MYTKISGSTVCLLLLQAQIGFLCSLKNCDSDWRLVIPKRVGGAKTIKFQGAESTTVVFPFVGIQTEAENMQKQSIFLKM